MEKLERSRVKRRSAALLLILLLVSCASKPLPMSDWHERWQQVADRVDATTAGELQNEDCQRLLVYLREQRPELTPPPLDDLKTPVREWFNHAEGLFFDCDIAQSDDVAQTLRALRAEIEVVITLETATPP